MVSPPNSLDEESGTGGAAGEVAVLALVGYLLKEGIPGDFSSAGAAERYLGLFPRGGHGVWVPANLGRRRLLNARPSCNFKLRA